MVDTPPECLANTISMPINNNKTPPAVLNAGKEMPRCDRKNSPNKAKENKITEAMITPLKAIDLLALASTPDVSAAKTAATSIGPIVAKNVAKATITVSNITCVANFYSLINSIG